MNGIGNVPPAGQPQQAPPPQQIWPIWGPVFQDFSIHMAAKKGLLDWVRHCIETDPTLNRISGKHWTPIMFAANRGHDLVVEYLISQGADLELAMVPEKLRKTMPPPIVCAAGGVRTDRDDNIPPFDTRTPAQKIVDKTECVRLLLQAGVNPNRANRNGFTALHEAACRGYVSIIRAILRDGRANVNAFNDQKRTPVSFAVKNGMLEAVLVLVDEGKADLRIRSKAGKTPLQLAQDENAKADREDEEEKEKAAEEGREPVLKSREARERRDACIKFCQEHEEAEKRKELIIRAFHLTNDTQAIKKKRENAMAKWKRQREGADDDDDDTEDELERHEMIKEAMLDNVPDYLKGRIERGQLLPAVKIHSCKNKVKRGHREEEKAAAGHGAGGSETGEGRKEDDVKTAKSGDKGSVMGGGGAGGDDDEGAKQRQEDARVSGGGSDIKSSDQELELKASSVGDEKHDDDDEELVDTLRYVMGLDWHVFECAFKPTLQYRAARIVVED